MFNDHSGAGSEQEEKTYSPEHRAPDWWQVQGLTCHCTQTSQRSVPLSWPVRDSQGRAPALLSGGS